MLSLFEFPVVPDGPVDEIRPVAVYVAVATAHDTSRYPVSVFRAVNLDVVVSHLPSLRRGRRSCTDVPSAPVPL